jgi:anaerobic magnesium-protoporphyrin IX monomethyl ester cyclase
MHIVLWDTRKIPVIKDLAGGFGAGPPLAPQGPGRWFFRHFFCWRRWPAPLTLASLAAVFHRLGHRVEYAANRFPQADLFVFQPALMTLTEERRAMQEVHRRFPAAQVLVVGMTASLLSEAFADLPVTVLQGEPEQLLWKFNEVLAGSRVEGRESRVVEGNSTFDLRPSTLDPQPSSVFTLGRVEELDRLPPPDWSPFPTRRFRIGYDFWRFPTALIQASRGCTFACTYCPYTAAEKGIRFRDPLAVAEEIRRGMRRWGFRSFKFRDPLFGQDPVRTYRLADLIGRLPQKIQFSVETRAEFLPPELLRALKDVGLTSVTVGIEAPDAPRLAGCHPSPGGLEPERRLMATCRQLGIRTVASFVVGFPEDDAVAIRRVARYARDLNPTFANFNLLTPYPGTAYFASHRLEIADFDFNHYTSYLPVMQMPWIRPKELQRLHDRCVKRFYHRWTYFQANAALLWPGLQRLHLFRQPRNLPPSGVLPLPVFPVTLRPNHG